MIDIIDFSNAPLSQRDLQYAGRAGEKRGIIADNEEDVAKMLINNEKSGIEKTLAYHEFHSC